MKFSKGDLVVLKVEFECVPLTEGEKYLVLDMESENFYGHPMRNQQGQETMRSCTSNCVIVMDDNGNRFGLTQLASIC